MNRYGSIFFGVMLCAFTCIYSIERGTVSLVGSINPSPGAFYVGVSASNNLAVVSNGKLDTYGVDLIDIVNPKNPVQLENWKPTDENCLGRCKFTEAERIVWMGFGEGVQIYNSYGYFPSNGGT